MKRFMPLIMTVLMTVASPSVAHAVNASLMLTDDQIVIIRANCVSVQGSLDRVRASDALTRYNLAQQFDVIATKLMAPMNSRVALNKLDGVALTKTTVDFNQAIAGFHTTYRQYGETMDQAVSIDCRNQPVAFFDTINQARTQRQAVRSHVESAAALIKQYREQVEGLNYTVPIAPTPGGEL